MRPIATALAALTLLAAAGCSDDDPATTEDPTPTSSSAERPSKTPAPTEPAGDGTAELRAAVTAYSDAFLTGEGAAAYALLSSRCQDRFTETEFAGVVDQAGELYGSALELQSFDAEISGDLARVTYSYDLEALNQDQEPWVREAGQWHQDDC